MATVMLDKVDKVYDNGYQAIHDLSLDIVDGELLVLVRTSTSSTPVPAWR